MCVGTHHKTGTIWMRRVFMGIARELGIRREGIWGEAGARRIPETGRLFIVNWSSFFPRRVWADPDAAFLHVIRDPRDVLISGCAYHQAIGIEHEKWLGVPRDDLGGATYQQHLRGLRDPEEKLLFEMENRHAQTLAEMLRWPYDDPRTIDLRYEDLIEDRDSAVFGAALERLGLSPGEVEVGRRHFWRNSLFGGLARGERRDARIGAHVASGRARRWERELPRRVAEIYARRHGEALIALGYERDHGWLDRLG